MDPLVGNIKREEGSNSPLCLVTRESSVPLPSPAVSVVRLHLSTCSDVQRPVLEEQQERRGLESVTATVNSQLHLDCRDVNPRQPKEENIEKTIDGNDHTFPQVPEVKESPHSDPTLCLCDTCGCQHVASGKCEACGAICHFKESRSLVLEPSRGFGVGSETPKPVKKRRPKEYQSPAESEADLMEKQKEQKTSENTEGPCVRSSEQETWSQKDTQTSGDELGDLWSWSSYLEEQKCDAAPLNLFREWQLGAQHKNGFKVGMKLEGIDPQHPSMYFILTVVEVCGFRIKLHFDGYSDCHDFWVNADSPDIHPAGWCERTGHKLQPPKGHETGFDFLKNKEKQFLLQASSLLFPEQFLQDLFQY